MSQVEILSSLIQGPVGQVWAGERNGWQFGDDAQGNVPICNWDGIACDDGETISSIDLEATGLQATFPSELGQLTSLTSLKIGNNSFHGTIPAEIERLTSLEILDVGQNELDGSLPDGVGSLAPLKVFRVSENRLHGTVPERVGNLPRLEVFHVNSNRFVGTVPNSLTSSDSKLKDIWLQDNLLSGTVPAAFAEMKHLTSLYLDQNKLTGEIHSDICKRRINADFSDYRFQGVHMARFPMWRDYCESIACPIGTFSRYGVWPCTSCAWGTVNPYLGRKGPCTSNDEKDILETLWRATNGKNWTESNNWFEPGYDYCEFTGISCDEELRVKSIVLRGFGLTGTIPDELGLLEHLEVLDLADNELTGYLPSDLRFAPLDQLEIHGNKITGVIPPMLCAKGGVNGNGEGGEYRCDYIACPAGTSSPGGRQSTGGVCTPCQDDSPFLGRTSCSSSPRMSFMSAAPDIEMPRGSRVLLSVGIFAGAFLFIALVATVFNRRRGRQGECLTVLFPVDYTSTRMTGRTGPPPPDPTYIGTFPDDCLDVLDDEAREFSDNVPSDEDLEEDERQALGETIRRKVRVNEEEILVDFRGRQEEAGGWNGPREDSEARSKSMLWLDVPRLEGDPTLDDGTSIESHFFA